ncbi:MAG: hypothetical protein K0U41_09950 [Gammaproteobacteria bacterium]|nr:hypothetical protein [Gammaproteobacteria bacterium]
MTSLKSLQERAYNTAVKMHLISPFGHYPLYLITKEDGTLDYLHGKWEEYKYTDKEGKERTRELSKRESLILGVPIAPECPKGCKVEPVSVLIRSHLSPDAKRYRSRNGLDMDAREEDNIKRERAIALAIRMNRELDYKSELPEISVKDSNRILAASCIVGYENIPSEDEKTFMEFDPNGVEQFLRDFEIAVEQILVFISDQKKFDTLS